MLISLRDCTGNGIAGASFYSDPPAADGVMYQGGDPSMTDVTGVGYALSLPPPSATIEWREGGVSVGSYSIDLAADEMVLAFLVQP